MKGNAMNRIHGLTLIAAVLPALRLWTLGSAEAQTVYIGNSLTVQNGAPDGSPPLVILGEYSPGGPLATSPALLPAGTVQDVKFYGQDYNFTLYALSYVGPGPHTNEQIFQVVASQTFSNSVPSVGTNTLAVTNFTVSAGNLLAFAGTGPYYLQPPTSSGKDATYSSSPSSYMATSPVQGQQFIVGTNGD